MKKTDVNKKNNIFSQSVVNTVQSYSSMPMIVNLMIYRLPTNIIHLSTTGKKSEALSRIRSFFRGK